jgi:hypothetical protein
MLFWVHSEPNRKTAKLIGRKLRRPPPGGPWRSFYRGVLARHQKRIHPNNVLHGLVSHPHNYGCRINSNASSSSCKAGCSSIEGRTLSFFSIGLGVASNKLVVTFSGSIYHGLLHPLWSANVCTILCSIRSACVLFFLLASLRPRSFLRRCTIKELSLPRRLTNLLTGGEKERESLKNRVPLSATRECYLRGLKVAHSFFGRHGGARGPFCRFSSMGCLIGRLLAGSVPAFAGTYLPSTETGAHLSSLVEPPVTHYNI